MTAHAFGVDIGGSGVKGAPVDLADGALLAERMRIPTPTDGGPDEVFDAVRGVVDAFAWDGPVGVTVPGVVNAGIVRSAVNLSGDWSSLDAAARLEAVLKVRVSVVNDADAAGLAEAAYGAGKGIAGLVMVLTFGTGIGSALILDGALVPNTEFGHLEFNGMEAEHYAAARLHEDGPLSFEEWAHRADEVINHFAFIFSPDLVIVGGGISKEFDRLAAHLTVPTRVVPATLRNGAGIVGAAMLTRGPRDDV